MAIPTTPVPPLDPNLYTGPTRMVSGPARYGTVVLNQYYGTPGAPEVARWLLVGTSGSVSFTDISGNDHSIPILLAGVWHYMLTSKINSAGTTATGLTWAS